MSTGATVIRGEGGSNWCPSRRLQKLVHPRRPGRHNVDCDCDSTFSEILWRGSLPFGRSWLREEHAYRWSYTHSKLLPASPCPLLPAIDVVLKAVREA